MTEKLGTWFNIEIRVKHRKRTQTHVKSKKITLLWLSVKSPKKKQQNFQCEQGKKLLKDSLGEGTKNKTKQPQVAKK